MREACSKVDMSYSLTKESEYIERIKDLVIDWRRNGRNFLICSSQKDSSPIFSL